MQAYVHSVQLYCIYMYCSGPYYRTGHRKSVKIRKNSYGCKLCREKLALEISPVITVHNWVTEWECCGTSCTRLYTWILLGNELRSCRPSHILTDIPVVKPNYTCGFRYTFVVKRLVHTCNVSSGSLTIIINYHNLPIHSIQFNVRV